MVVVIKKSKFSGKGVFASRNFKKGQVVMIWNCSAKIKRDKINNLSKHDKEHLNYIGKEYYVIMKSPEKYVNHSCNPNTYVANKKDIAIRDIKKGENYNRLLCK